MSVLKSMDCRHATTFVPYCQPRVPGDVFRASFRSQARATRQRVASTALQSTHAVRATCGNAL